MTEMTLNPRASASGGDWLKRYYVARAAFSIVWVAAAIVLGTKMPLLGAVLLVVYPAWDALANWVDARRNGGLTQNYSQALNVAVSSGATAAVAIALPISMHAVLGVFGTWAILAGAFQLVTGVRRWKVHGAQWAMILSGAQSALAGSFFIMRAGGTQVPTIADIAPYAAFGAFYFLVSAVSLVLLDRRIRKQSLGVAGPG
ncbi:DUF308 domain-containing protein [Variovorax sp. Sphag1AA]|uniref:DUF308 domain-containing protein n=1 Tax=Variovorax sp. Sphag1AA TaxID=2587027 RepID=UPI001617141C|nr:DUF308 domain-containing protein [Variovorax sp. Sphag1AA]MBB3182423.1 uncharacterized membrane protein HdeD (DUF308 family) [Variovorax sp. Sphag1AA]